MSESLSEDRGYFSWVGLLYLVLLFVPVPLVGKLQACDLMAPLLLWRCWQCRKELFGLCRSEFPSLIFALVWMALATILQRIRGAGGGYDLAVFLYMALIFAFYRVTPLPAEKYTLVTGIALLCCVFGCYLLTKLPGAENLSIVQRLLYVDRHFSQLGQNVLVTRFQFLTTNPNLLGGSFILPTLLCLPTLRRALQSRKSDTARRQLLRYACAVLLTIVALLPLLATASKMSVMTFGLAVGCLAVAAPQSLKPLRPRLLATGAILAFGLLCLTTVYFRTYPAIRQAPFVDFGARGNYSVHQEIYAKIFAHGGVSGALFGHAPVELHELYPRYADESKIRGILEPYGFSGESALYATFMDPHNEYLNTLSFFGMPALLGLLLFLGTYLWKALQQLSKNSPALPTALFLAGVLFCFFWEDAASKRFLWAALGCLVASCQLEGKAVRSA